MKRRSIVAVAIAAFGLGALTGTLAWLAVGYAKDAAPFHGRPTWTEVAWPFLLDEWGKGKAFQCKAADCGTQVNLYLRAKIGFCNCTTGIADDEELDRLSDFNLMGSELAAVSAGQALTVAGMAGRSRAYAVVGSKRAGNSVLSVAFNDRCDAIVATVVVGHDRPSIIEPSVIEFLNGSTVRRWAEVTLGL